MDSKLSLNSDEYMKLMITQLENQNPMDPMDNSKMLSQMSDMASLEATKELQGSFDNVMELVNLTGGANLVGREVEYEQDGTTARATVDAVNVKDGQLNVQCGDKGLDLSDIKTVL